MELKELLGEELYKQVQAKIDEKNSAETDKLKHVRYTDLSEGKYVSKEKQRTYHDASSKVNTRILANGSSGIVTEDGLLEFGNL